MCTTPTVQAAWAEGQAVCVYGVIYNLKDGLVKRLVGPITRWAGGRLGWPGVRCWQAGCVCG